MTEKGRRATPSFTSLLLVTIAVMIIENMVNTQLIRNMETVSARARVECFTLANVMEDSTFAVTSPSSVSWVNQLLLGTVSDVVVKSTGPASPIVKRVIGTDLFVALSTAKANAVKSYRSNGVAY